MTRIVVDARLADQLRQATEPVELVDATGEVLASFHPNNGTRTETEYERTEPPIAEEELQRREKSDKWFTTQEVLDHLSRLENK